ncbi:uncharacterized protein P884DRAFT_253872 [Thermothelomyces heterothallicus CBS 202.75]|uniref:uncharacterized protein n=1 Tax=Thermothelomyces heterothallicus CBS 202.75 TaxID=1149848 RepID=UPI003741F2A5
MSKPGWVPGYSDLPEPIDQHQNYPEVVASDYPYPATTFYEQDKHLAHSDHATALGYPFTPAAQPTTVPSEPEGRVLGLRRRTCIWLAAICGVLVVIGIGLGVGLGLGLRSSGSSDQEGSPTAASTPSPSRVPDAGSTNSTNLFEGSSLAATNYTDPDGYVHLYVFFQAANKELTVSKWDSQNETWATLSISKMLSSTGLNLDLIPASPIAAYTYLNSTFQTRVYFLTTGNSIREIITSEDPSLTSNWRQGLLGSSKSITADQGSKLAALRPQCGTGEDCQVYYPSMAIAYQGDDGVIALSRADDWKPMDIQFGPAEPGAVIGLASVMRDNITDVGWSLFFDEDGTLQEFNSELLLSQWTRGKSTGFAPDAGSGSPNIASFSYDLVNIMIVDVDPDGDLEVRTWDTRSWSDLQPPNLVPSDGAPESPKFSAVAGNSQRRVFGIADGVIHQWEFFSLSPLQWSYRGVVPTEVKP